MAATERKGFAAILRNVLATIELSFRELARIQYAAPWENTHRGAC
jgi:hypothetical protein